MITEIHDEEEVEEEVIMADVVHLVREMG